MKLVLSSCALLLCGLLVLHTAAAEESRSGEQFALDRFNDARRLIEGPRAIPPVAVPSGMDCIALYEKRVALQGRLNDYKPEYWSDPRNGAAVFLGTVWTPAFYFLGYSAVTANLDDSNDIPPQAEIDALRRASAAQRCFEK